MKSKSKKTFTVETRSVDFQEYGDIDFSYQVTGVRDGFEKYESVVSVANLAKSEENVSVSAAVKRGKLLAERVRRAGESARR